MFVALPYMWKTVPIGTEYYQEAGRWKWEDGSGKWLKIVGKRQSAVRKKKIEVCKGQKGKHQPNANPLASIQLNGSGKMEDNETEAEKSCFTKPCTMTVEYHYS